MRDEAFFSGDSPYEVLVRGNVLLHREAAEQLAGILAKRGAECPVRVLDLACGPCPLIPYEAFARLPELRFEYHGVDINPEVVTSARAFPLPDNVVEASIQEGDAWDLRDLRLEPSHDLVFVGFNWHHGVPEELAGLARQVHPLLGDDGALVNHDCYRPSGEPYQRRPDDPAPDPETVDCPEWRQDLIDRLVRGHGAHGGTPAGRRIMVEHSLVRDFPMSVPEVAGILEQVGFRVEIRRFDPAAELSPHLAMLIARPR